MKSKQADSFQQVTLGPIKIRDGLFMGDELAAKDIQFIISNKVTHIINTVVHKIPNLWQNFCIHYLSVGWTEKQTNIFDKKNNALNAIFNFIEEAVERGESCLVHSVNGKTRSCTIVVAYLMKKYKWSLGKCLQFVDSRKQFLQIRINYLSQLEVLETKFKKQNTLNDKWDVSHSQQEQLMNHTFRNSLSLPSEFKTPVMKRSKTKQSRRIQWIQGSRLNIEEDNEILYPLPKCHPQKLKPILKSPQKNENYEYYKQKQEQESLDRILFESQKKKKNSQHDEQKIQRTSRNTTVQMRAGSHQKKQFNSNSNYKSSNSKNMTIKKMQHYNQVLASYHSVTDSKVKCKQLFHSMQSIQFSDKNVYYNVKQNNEEQERSQMQSERCNSERKKMAQKKRRRKTNVSHSPKRKGGKPKMKEKVYAQ